ncbi:MAG: MerR family transcriptional regulator [Mangrovibacterium sp.]
MPYKKPQIEKVFYSIGEVADLFGFPPSTIRYWEKKFGMPRPQKNKKGNRQYTPRDIEQIKLIFHLVRERKMTLEGARRKIRDNREETVANHELVERLLKIRGMLSQLQEELD